MKVASVDLINDAARSDGARRAPRCKAAQRSSPYLTVYVARSSAAQDDAACPPRKLTERVISDRPRDANRDPARPAGNVSQLQEHLLACGAQSRCVASHATSSVTAPL